MSYPLKAHKHEPHPGVSQPYLIPNSIGQCKEMGNERVRDSDIHSPTEEASEKLSDGGGTIATDGTTENRATNPTGGNQTSVPASILGTEEGREAETGGGLSTCKQSSGETPPTSR